jgi:hypothetical protein
MRAGVSVVAMLLLFPLFVVGQHAGHRGSTGSSGGTTTPAEDPDLATFNHAVAVQASEEQTAQFNLMIESTKAAQRQAREVQNLSSKGSNAEDLTREATGLQDSIEEAQNQNRIFRRSLSDSQEAGLKNLTKKLTKSNSAVSKGAKAISQELDERTLSAERLVKSAANLEKALAEFQLDQLNLGKEMGIQPH